MATTFNIPKLTDRDVIAALGRVRETIKPLQEFKVRFHVPHRGDVVIEATPPEDEPSLKFVFDAASQTIPHFDLIHPTGHLALRLERKPESVMDKATIRDEWHGYINEQTRRQLPEIAVALTASARAELKASEVEAAFKGSDDNSWNRYRDAQMAVVNSLQQALETLLIKTADKNAELDRTRSARFEQLEKDLREEISNERKTLQGEFETKEKTLEERTKGIADRESAFNTKEARYVARKKQEEQIEQVKTWLNDWKLTQGTTEKRRGVFWAYVAALVITGVLTAYATYHNYQILKTADDIAKLQWWHWLAIISKSFFPLAAFTTFMVYFIRWSSGWARQHADEEFINRTRLIDIGRSAWLLEAVRDAQERNKEIPPELLKELSRNLFTHTATNDGDVQPQAAADILLQGLSSLRVKSADGTEVEAKRGK